MSDMEPEMTRREVGETMHRVAADELEQGADLLEHRTDVYVSDAIELLTEIAL